jgi:hypothetical protein
MATTKSIKTVQQIEAGGVHYGLIMQDESGLFYRQKGKSGLHNPKHDGMHCPDIAAVKQALLNSGDEQQVKAGHALKAPKAAPKAKEEAPKEAAPKATKEPVKQPAKEPAKPAHAVEVPPAGASKVRYKLVEASGAVGTHYWLYAGYEHATGFKWNGSGGFMFLNMNAVNDFLRSNGIDGNIEVETVDVTNGSYDPNKGVVALYKVGQQSLSL